MTISLSNWQLAGYVLLLVLVLQQAWSFRRSWISGVLDYGYNRVERALDAKRFKFWFIADVVIFALMALSAAGSIGLL
jgi:hypothetical protein